MTSSPRLFDIANLLSLVRIPLAALVWLRPGDPWFLLGVVAAAAVSDGLDGRVGRKSHAGLVGTKNIGSWLDPVCDKIFMVSAVVAVAVAYQPAPALVALLLVRDVAVALLTAVFRIFGGRALFHAHDFRSTISGKATTALQVATVIAVVFFPAWAMWLAELTGVVGVVAVLDRVRLVWRQRRAPSP